VGVVVREKERFLTDGDNPLDLGNGKGVALNSEDSMDNPKQSGAVSPTIDVADPQRALSLFQQLWDSAPDAMAIVDQDGRIVLVNGRLEQVFGFRREELLGAPIDVLIPAQAREKHREHIAKYRDDPRVRLMGIGLELSALRKDGSEFPAEISLSPLKSDRGMLVFSVIRDVTERQRAEKSNREIQAQLLAAQRIQEHLLPQAPPTIPGLDIAGASHPAEFTAGDYFDYLPMTDGSLGLVIADVAGHGFGPALLMATIHARLRSLAEICTHIGQIVARANTVLCRETQADRFVTLFLGRLDPATRSLTYVNAGHPAGYVINASGAVKATLDSTSVPLGIVADEEFPVGGPVLLAPGDLVLLLTDGILETVSSGGEQFGVERVLELVRANRHKPAGELIDSLRTAAIAFSDHATLLDDLTIVVVKMQGAID
jgi:PAS domain S-box-containing protein